MYKWYRSASGANGPSMEILPCHEVVLPLRCSAIVVLFGRMGSHRLVELPMWDGNGKAGRADSQHWILELKIIQARNVRKLAWLRDNVSDTRQYNPLLIFHVLGVLDVCRLINYGTEHD